MSEETFDGYDRVTTVANYFGKKFAQSARGDEAKDIGTKVDGIIKDSIVRGVDLSTKKFSNSQIQSAITGFCSWKRNYNLLISVGIRLFNDDLKITGEPDLYAPYEIIDIKCALKIYPSYWIQMGGYLCLKDAAKVSILRLGKTASDYEYKCSVECSRLKTLFISALNLYRYYKEEENG